VNQTRLLLTIALFLALPGACKQKERPQAAEPVTGVPVCDEFLAKFQACIADHVPEPQQAPLRMALEAHREAWKGASTTVAQKAGLAATCRHVAEVTKQKTAGFGCKW
jgi:hypothetical protein